MVAVAFVLVFLLCFIPGDQDQENVGVYQGVVLWSWPLGFASQFWGQHFTGAGWPPIIAYPVRISMDVQAFWLYKPAGTLKMVVSSSGHAGWRKRTATYTCVYAYIMHDALYQLWTVGLLGAAGSTTYSSNLALRFVIFQFAFTPFRLINHEVDSASKRHLAPDQLFLKIWMCLENWSMQPLFNLQGARKDRYRCVQLMNAKHR